MLPKELNSKDSGVMYIISYAAMFLEQIVLGIILVGFADLLAGNIPESVMWVLTSANQVIFLFVPALYMMNKGIKPIQIAGYKRKLSGKQLIMLPIITLTLLIASAPIAFLFSYLLQAIGYSSTGTSFTMDSPSTLLLGVFVIAVMPAICEEFLFRNSILRGMKKKGYLFAAIVTSAMFSLMHGNPEQLIHQFFVGLTLAFLMQVTGTLWAPMIVHFCNNLFSIVLGFILTDELLGGASEQVFIAVLIVLIVLGFPLVVSLLKYFVKLEKEKRGEYQPPEAMGRDAFGHYFESFKDIISYLFSSKFRKAAKQSYNALMGEMDYYKEEELPPAGSDMEIYRLIMKSKDNLGAVTIGMIGAGVMVILAFFGGMVTL